MQLLYERPNFGLEIAIGADPAGDADAIFLGGPKPIVHLFGDAPALPTTVADFWDQNIARTLWSAGVRLAFASSAAADASAGTGARTIRAWLVKSDYTIVTEDIVLNGQTKVESVGLLYLRCLKMQVLTVGSGGLNAGDIYCFDSTDTYTLGVPQTAAKIAGRIGIGFNVTHHGWYTVPLGFKALLLSYRFSTLDATATAKYGRGLLCYQSPTIPLVTLTLGQIASPSAPEGFRPVRPHLFDEKTDIMLKGNMSAAGDASVFAELLLQPKAAA